MFRKLILMLLCVVPLSCAGRGDVYSRASDPDADIRREAVVELSRYDTPKAGVVLRQKLKDPDALVRAAAVRALAVHAQRQDTPSARQSAASDILPLLRDNDPWVRMNALEAVGNLMDTAAVPEIIGVLRVEDTLEVKLIAIRWLEKFADKRAIPVLVDTLSDPDQNVAFRALDALRSITGQDFGTDPKKWQEMLLSPP